MRTLAFAWMLTACWALAAPASDDLVDTARDAKANRRKSTTKVITNADVKKAKAKVATTNAPATPVQPEPTLMEKHQAGREAARIETEQRTALTKIIAGLEKELASIEQRYYEENDLNRRDAEIVKLFDETKVRLDSARKELAAIGSPPES